MWLNTPTRPLEASGTSGMKACINGAIHASTLDGWWPEGYSKETGWAIGQGEELSDHRHQDYSDAQALYNIIESEIVPTFYDRPNGELPNRWIKMMKASIKMSLNRFSSTRMVSDYYEGSYRPALDAFAALGAEGFSALRSEVTRHSRIKAKWNSVHIEFPVADRDLTENFVGDEFSVTSRVRLGEISPNDVKVEIFLGDIDVAASVKDGSAQQMELVEDLQNGNYLYTCKVTCHKAGAYGFSARVTPRNAALRDTMPGYMTWADL